MVAIEETGTLCALWLSIMLIIGLFLPCFDLIESLSESSLFYWSLMGESILLIDPPPLMV